MIISPDRFPRAHWYFGSLFLLVVFGGCGWFADVEQVTFYNTYAYQKGDMWLVPLRARVYEPSRRAELVTEATEIVSSSLSPKDQSEKDNLQSRLGELLAENESRESVTIRFDEDEEDFPKPPQEWRTNKGMMVATLELSNEKVSRLLETQKSHGWLTFRATSPEHVGKGRLQIIKPTGLSVISDIDDTIKITEVPAPDKMTVFNNTFFRKFQAVPQREELYAGLEEASFHYVSGSPWQLNKPLVDFLFREARFPEGSLHMSDLVQDLRKNLKAIDVEYLWALVKGDGTYDQKITQISEIMTQFPKRHFVLIGDSGECDPEVYRTMKSRFENQVLEIRIRDVVNDWTTDCGKPEGCTRLKDMKVIRAEAVPGGISRQAKGSCGSVEQK